jgi:probable HAF family extracellular repeat protein
MFKEPAMSTRLTLSTFLLLALLLTPAAGKGAPRFKIKVVGPTGSVATDLNRSGQFVGHYDRAGAERAFRNTGVRPHDLGTLGGSYSYAFAINDQGRIVGLSENADGYGRAFVYNGGRMSDIGTLGGLYSEAHDINAAGQIVGGASTPDTPLDRAFLYSRGVMHNLYGLPEGDASTAYGINYAGQVVGRSAISTDDPPEHPYHAFLYSEGKIVDLGTLGGLFSSAYAINEAGVIVGDTNTEEELPSGHFVTHAFLYADGVMQDLGTFGGAETFSKANAINNRGQVVGWADDDTSTRAFLFEGGKMLDLNTLVDAGAGWFLREATAINDRQQITVIGCREGQCQALRLDPVRPLLGFDLEEEPLEATLIATGLSLAGALRRTPPDRTLLAETYTPQ